MNFLKMSGELKNITTSEIIRNYNSRIWHLPNAPVLDISNVYMCIYGFAFMCMYVYIMYMYMCICVYVYVYINLVYF